jgi:hypothetical protein
MKEYIIGTLNRTRLHQLLHGKMFFDEWGERRQASLDRDLIYAYVAYSPENGTWRLLDRAPEDMPEHRNFQGRLPFVTIDKYSNMPCVYTVFTEDWAHSGEIASDVTAVLFSDEKRTKEVETFVKKVIADAPCSPSLGWRD